MVSITTRTTRYSLLQAASCLLVLSAGPLLAQGNTPPSSSDDVLLVADGVGLNFDYLLLNDSDAESDALTITGTTTPATGALIDHGGAAFTYTPAGVGDDSFDYTVSDGLASDTATVHLSVNAAFNAEAARDAILAGVTSLVDPIQPGHMVVWGPTAQVISSFPGQDERDPMIVAATMGSGRIIAMPDHQWLEMDSHGSDASSGNFYRNGIAWLAGTGDKTIKVVTFNSSAATWLGGDGFTNVVNASSATLASELANADVLVIWPGNNPSEDTINAIIAFTKSGGGLFICDYGIGYDWWWGKATPDIPGNRILRDAGIAFNKQWPHASGPQTINRATTQTTDDDVIAVIADPGSYGTTEKDRVGEIFKRLNDGLAEDDTLQARLDAEFRARISTLNPTPATPVSDSLDRALLKREADILKDLPATEVTAHRTAEAVYGVIPPGAPRITQTVTIDATRSRWSATGMYAVPGELVTVTVPPSMVGQGYKIRINAHTDQVSRTTLERMPYVHRSYPIDSSVTQVACAFGGAVFIDFGGDAWSGAPALGNVDVEIANAIEHPFFDLSQHTDADWVNALRDKPAPYAVFVSDNLMICQRSSESATLTTPTALMTWWNKVVADQDWVGGRLTARVGPEFVNVDVQQSAGSAHSGYPVQGYDKYWGNLANYQNLSTSGSWGDFHELGHNHQRGWWNFGPDGEVTVNIFSNYNLETMASNPTTSGWGWSADPVQVIDEAVSNVAPGGTYVSKSKRWSFWFQLADGFGWDLYRDVLMSYEQDNVSNPSALPSTNIEKQDQFYTRWSIISGYDMADFMIDTWGLEVTQPARDAVDALNLPDWLPVVATVTSVVVFPDTPLTVDLEGSARSMDGVVTLTTVTAPSHGTMVNHGDGTVTYTPATGFTGDDSFTYTLQSSSGNTVETTVAILVPSVPDLLLAHWKLDEGTGTMAADSSGNGKDATLQGATWADPRDGSAAIATNGTGAQYVEGPSLDTAAGLTVTAWIRPASLSGSHVMVSEKNSYAFKTYNSGLLFTTPGILDHYSSGVSLVVNEWNHLAVTFQPGTTGGVKFYVNGDLASTGNASAMNQGAEPTILGNTTNWTGQSYDGSLDDVRIYSGVLSGDQIAGIHNSYPAIVTNNPPVAYDGTGNVTESAAPGTLVATVSAVDPDAGDSLTYAITGGNDGSFGIDPNTGEITVAAGLDYETNASYALTVTATDVGGLSDEAFLNITVEPDNDGDGLSDATDPDDDEDTIPDTWETANGLDPLTANTGIDSDSDGYSDLSEYIFDTAASNANSKPELVIEPGGVNLSIHLKTSSIRHYVVEYRDDLASGIWRNLVDGFDGTGAEVTLTDSSGAARRFYRVRASIP